MIGRRSMLRGAAATMATAALPAWRLEAAAAGTTLKAAAARAGLRYGAYNDPPIITAPEPYRALVLEQCELLAPVLSWKFEAPTRDGAEPDKEDPNLRWALEHGLDLTGGHLLWHLGLPSWFLQIGDATEAQTAVLSHIHALTEHYKGKVFCWNVVNEVLQARSGRPDRLRETPLLAKLGDDFFDIAFRTARSADPGAFLALNEDDLEMDRDAEQKRAALLRLLDRFAADDTPIDAVGLQSHLSLDGGRFDEKSFRAFLAELASRRLRIVISELDVLDIGAPTDHAARDQAVADMYSRFLSVALDETAVMAVVTWGLSDRYTWLTPAAGPKYARADHEAVRALPYDDAFQPKPAFEAMLNAFAHAPMRDAVRRRSA
jgi:endo-1,4-beta-xylanase